MPRPLLSVVICTHNGAAVLPRALRGLRKQSLSASDYEVIVVDDGSTDATPAIATAHQATLVGLPRNVGLAAARNAGVATARGELVAFTDDDCEPHYGWTAALVEAFAEFEAVGVGGSVHPGGTELGLILRYLESNNPLSPLPASIRDTQSWSLRLSRYLRVVLKGEPELRRGDPLYSVVGANMAFRRDTLLAVSGFDEAYTFGSEEEDLCRRIHAFDATAQLVYEPTASVTHLFKSSLVDTLRRSRAYGRGKGRNLIKHRAMRPIVYPFPLAMLLLLSASIALRRRGLAAVAAVTPLMTYPLWVQAALQNRRPEAAVYPYIRAAEEIFTMIGELQGWLAGYEVVPPTHLELADPPQ